MRLDNFLSLFLGAIEIFSFSGICFGFPFIEFILKDELVFQEEFCEDSNGNELCNKAKEQYNLLFTVAVTSSVSLPFFKNSDLACQ